MRQRTTMIALSAILIAAVLAVAGAVFAATLIERRAAAEIRHALAIEGVTWAEVRADGLLVHLTGTAPDEATRFRVLSAAGRIIDAARVIDEMQVTPSAPVVAPEFSLELLRNDAGVSIIGLIPAGDDRLAIGRAVAVAAPDSPVTDMLDSAAFPEPDGWSEALDYGLAALAELPRAKISVSARRVAITAIVDSQAAKRRLESELARKAPPGLKLEIDISAPRPVITPFTLRFLLGPDGARFDACSADTPEAEARILSAARAAGLEGKARCTIGLGVPTPDWAEAVETGIAALNELGGGNLTFTDADVTLIALDTVPQPLFDRVTGELEADLPEVFSLHAVRPEPAEAGPSGADDAGGPPEFLATRSPEGDVQLRGRVTDDLAREATESYAVSRFGTDNVYAAMRLDAALPDGWPIRVLTALEGLSQLRNGTVVVRPDFVELDGTADDADARARIARIFAEKLGEAQNYSIEVRYLPPPEPVEELPTPEECVARINDLLAERKITFEPGEITLERESLQVVEKIADVLLECPDVPIEIGGHTDSQGREQMNQQLSQQRAESVLGALMARRIITSNLTAKGYGESEPIADNDTEEGREANRRIEFKLVLPEEEVPAEESGDAVAAEAAGTSAAEETTGDAPAETGTDSTDEPD